MKIIISPAKKINIDTDSFAIKSMPIFIEDTAKLMRAIQTLSREEAQRLWKCNDKLTDLNYERFRHMDLERGLTPAVMAYEGLQYQHMLPSVFTEDALTYIEQHLCILSGFYGVLKSFDGITPYRLEMQAKLVVHGAKDLYELWGSRLYDEVMDEDRTVVNLASKEYSKCIEKYVTEKDRFITVNFVEMIDGKLKQKGTLAKMARGEMVRYMAENGTRQVEGMKEFGELGFSFAEEYSSEERYVFVK
ncbi:MAG: peroxide stress protein YaaA [Anaerostipes sp.]